MIFFNGTGATDIYTLYLDDALPILLAGAGGFQSGRLDQRLVLVDRAEAHTRNAERRPARFPLRQLGALPLLGRDIRVARARSEEHTSELQSRQYFVCRLLLDTKTIT